MSWGDISTVATFGIAFAALVFSIAFNLLGHLDRRSAAEDRKQAAKLAREKELRNWAREVACAYVDLQNEGSRDAAFIRLGIFVDYGRLFFPNDTSPEALKLSERGLRSAVLDPLVETCKRCNRGDWNVQKMQSDWREFTDRLHSHTTAFAINTSPESAGRSQYRNQ